MCGLRDHRSHTYKIEGNYLKTCIGRMVWIVWNNIWEAHGGSGQ